MKKRGPGVNDTFVELLVGIGLYGLVGILLILLLLPGDGDSLNGFLIGVVVSAAMLTHMYIELEKSLYMGENGALKHTRVTTCFRMIAVTAVMVIVAWTGIADVISALVGVMALKVSAYIQPLTHRYYNKIKKGR